MNDKIKQRARELYANEWSKIDSHYAAGIRSGDILATPEIRAITAALNESAPKPEAQAAGVDVRARYFLASGLDEYGHHSEAQNVRDGEDLESYRHELFAIKAALSTPASHDAQQPTNWLAELREGADYWREKCSILQQRLDAQQPAVVGEWTDEQIIAVCKTAGINWIERDPEEYGLPGGFDIAHMPEMRRLFTALTPAATPGEQKGDGDV